MAQFVFEQAEPWFRLWLDYTSLLGENSPLHDFQKAALTAAMAGNAQAKNIEHSRRLLKLI
ncbi:hypothetical protein ACTSKR_05185 [Chitinibacteraceae bacterium HSL-7]